MEKTPSRAKGIAFKELLLWLDQRLGREKVLQALAQLPPEYKGIVWPEAENFGILASSWYPLPCVHKLIDGLTATMTRQARFGLAQEAARVVMDVTLHGVYKAIVRAFISPTLYAKFATKLWQSYYDSGDFKVVIADNGLSADCTIHNWSGHHPFVCDMNIAAATAIYEAMGQKRVSTQRVACMGEGGPLCRYITTWGERQRSGEKRS
jgi:predicted hydrocarbon binding protein